MEPFVISKATNLEVQNVISSLIRVFNSIQNNPLLNSPYIGENNVFTSGTDLIISHKLNRLPKAFIPLNPNAAAHIYESSTTNPFPTKQIILKASANVTTDILFF